MAKKDIPLDERKGYWPCGCVKRDRSGNMTHIKSNHPSVKRCRKCGCDRPPEWEGTEEGAFYFTERRDEGPEHPGGLTVSKKAQFPASDFRITEYCWGQVSLWFVDGDEFTDDERQEAYQQFVALNY